ncbi:type II toxin-antitoxin system Phd/YefM family antitoxin [Candidatus Poribacteria bacterium]|nr:type II toxin-antitoxin system Phd/YefM family antitoxin [Candidatus Poribacteria bacterium]
MANINATEAREDFFDLIKNAINKHQIFHIHHRQGDAVLLSEEEYSSLQETLELLSIPEFRKRLLKSVKQIEKGETYSMNEVFEGKNNAI